MKIKFKKLTEDAHIPVKAHDSDFCYDIYASSDAENVKDKYGNIVKNILKYHTGIAMQIERSSKEMIFKDWKEPVWNIKDSNIILDIDARPRSSIYKTGLSLCNCTATIDEPYTGEICLFFYDIVPSLPKYKKGDRIAQIKLGFTLPIEFEEVESLDETDRGSGGFGSTGK